MSIVGSSYLLRGEPVTVVCVWRAPRNTDPVNDLPLLRLGKTPPRNVTVEYASGERVTRPFRGLRKPPTSTTSTGVLP